jgi:predicted enzyme related to lactoylglutathione lyase
VELERAVPILTVDDLASAVSVYQDVLGLDVLMDHGWIVTLGTAPRAELSLITHDQTATTNPVASVEVEDVDAAYDAAVAAGVPIVHPLTDEEWGVRRFFFVDPAGNVVNVLSHR